MIKVKVKSLQNVSLLKSEYDVMAFIEEPDSYVLFLKDGTRVEYSREVCSVVVVEDDMLASIHE